MLCAVIVDLKRDLPEDVIYKFVEDLKCYYGEKIINSIRMRVIRDVYNSTNKENVTFYQKELACTEEHFEHGEYSNELVIDGRTKKKHTGIKSEWVDVKEDEVILSNINVLVKENSRSELIKNNIETPDDAIPITNVVGLTLMGPSIDLKPHSETSYSYPGRPLMDSFDKEENFKLNGIADSLIVEKSTEEILNSIINVVVHNDKTIEGSCELNLTTPFHGNKELDDSSEKKRNLPVDDSFVITHLIGVILDEIHAMELKTSNGRYFDYAKKCSHGNDDSAIIIMDANQIENKILPRLSINNPPSPEISSFLLSTSKNTEERISAVRELSYPSDSDEFLDCEDGDNIFYDIDAKQCFFEEQQRHSLKEQWKRNQSRFKCKKCWKFRRFACHSVAVITLHVINHIYADINIASCRHCCFSSLYEGNLKRSHIRRTHGIENPKHGVDYNLNWNLLDMDVIHAFCEAKIHGPVGYVIDYIRKRKTNN